MISSHKKVSGATRPVGIDLFAGAGGMSLGFEQAGFDIKAAVEIDPVHRAVHEFNFPYCASICADASKITGEDIRRKAELGKSQVDIVFGGAPCQGFSMMGKRALDDPRNRLLLEFLRLTVELDAQYFVFENVRGLTIGQHRILLEELIEAFQENGYDMHLPYRVLNAADFSVPQDRRRLFLLGAKKGLPLPNYPQTVVLSAAEGFGYRRLARGRSIRFADGRRCCTPCRVWQAFKLCPHSARCE